MKVCVCLSLSYTRTKAHHALRYRPRSVHARMYNGTVVVARPIEPILILHASVGIIVYHNSHQPILSPSAKPAMNVALGWKSAVKKSMIHRKSEATLGGFLTPETSLV